MGQNHLVEQQLKVFYAFEINKVHVSICQFAKVHLIMSIIQNLLGKCMRS